MFRMIARKMLKTRWMMLCLLLGVVIAAATLSSVPQYTAGILQTVLINDLENYQKQQHAYFPGAYQISGNVSRNYLAGTDDSGQARARYNQLRASALEALDSLKLPYYVRVQTLVNSNYKLVNPQNKSNDTIMLTAMSGMNDHVKLIEGSLPGTTATGGAYDVVVSQNAFDSLSLQLGRVYPLRFYLNAPQEKKMSLRVVGVFTQKAAGDPYWYQMDQTFISSFFIDYNLFEKDFASGDYFGLTGAEWYEAFDYHSIDGRNIQSTAAAIQSGMDGVHTTKGASVTVPALAILTRYGAEQQQLRTLLLALQTPVMLMLIFYLFMVALLIIEQERGEIAVLASRGASRFQIFRSYLLEGVILGGAALVIGPLFGLFISSVLGLSTGFLEFVQRTGLPIHLSETAYIYALAAVGVFLITLLMPTFFASRTSIVEHHQRARKKKRALWKRFYLDIVLLCVSGYGIYSFYTRSPLVRALSSADTPVNPLLLILSTVFILGCGLLFLRIHPVLCRALFFLGRKHWRPGTYASLLHVARSAGREQFLILFLTLTISIGVLGATTARTMDNNNDQRIRYKVGADMTMTGQWVVPGTPAPPGGGAPGASAATPSKYEEPDFARFATLSGVKLATKVINTNRAAATFDVGPAATEDVSDSNMMTGLPVQYMGIIPGEFGQVAWFRDGLLPYHFNDYLNLLTQKPDGLILSTSFQKKYDVKPGDVVAVQLGSSGFLSGYALAFVDYWPGLDPSAGPGGEQNPDFVVGNFYYFQDAMPLTPYQVWVKLQPGATSAQVYDDIKKKNIRLTQFSDAGQQIMDSRSDPGLQGVNGSLTLSFLVTMLVAAAGFLIYWIMDIRARTLQFGILRAIGVKYRGLLWMLVVEQLLLSITSVLAGGAIGALASAIFVPVTQSAMSTAQQVPPFAVFWQGSDYAKIFIIAAAILLAGLIVLGVIIRRIQMGQAIKLGEDAA